MNGHDDDAGEPPSAAAAMLLLLGPGTTPEAPSPDGDAISLMITRRQRAALRDLGLTDEAIAQMTPAEAHRRLRDGI